MSSSSEDSPIYVDSICFRTVVRKNVSPFFLHYGENIAGVQTRGSLKWDRLQFVLRLIVHLFSVWFCRD
jgi:hypothetical protein